MSNTGTLQNPVATRAGLNLGVFCPECIVIVAVSAAFLLAEIPAAIRNPFWFDELSTLFITQRPTLADMFRAMPTDGNPPLYFLLARLCLHLPVSTELAMRLPSIAAFHAAALAAYLFIRRVASAPAALLTMCFLLGSAIGDRYAIEARGYSLLLFFTMALLCCWQAARRGQRRTFALAGITVCASCAVLTHQFGIIYALAPIFAAETVAWFRIRRIDTVALASAVLGSLIIGLTYPPMLRGQRMVLAAIAACPHFWARPQPSDIGWYADMFPTFVPLLALRVAVVSGLAYAVLPRRKPLPARKPSTLTEEFAATYLLILFLPLMLLLTRLGTGYFVSRYAIGSALGLALACGLLASYMDFRSPRARKFLYLAGLYCITSGVLRFYFESHPETPMDYGNSLFATAPASEPIVIESALHFSPAWWYASPAMRPRLHYLSDLPFAQQQSDLVPEYSLYVERRYTPMQMDDYSSFLAEHREFLVYTVGQSGLEWLRPRLLKSGWTFRLVTKNNRGELYQATAPGQTTKALPLQPA
jgi:hypothetical protein